VELVTFLAKAAKPPAARCFVVAAGQLCGPALAASGIDALVALSPDAMGDRLNGPTPPTMTRVGEVDTGASADADSFFRSTRGWTVVSSFGTAAQSTGLFSSEWDGHDVDQTLMFLRDYRLG